MTKQKINDMSVEEAENFFGKELWKDMNDTGLLSGITCAVNSDGKLIIYKCDLENALHAVKTGRELFWD